MTTRQGAVSERSNLAEACVITHSTTLTNRYCVFSWALERARLVRDTECKSSWSINRYTTQLLYVDFLVLVQLDYYSIITIGPQPKSSDTKIVL